MDPQFEQWQKAFKAATPNVDAEKLIKQVTRAQRNMKVKAYIDLCMAVAVSIYAAYTAFFLTTSNWEMWGIGSLSPVALLFGIWSFSFRQKQWQMETTDVSSMLTFKRHQYQRQVTYWWYSALACAGLFWRLTYHLRYQHYSVCHLDDVVNPACCKRRDCGSGLGAVCHFEKEITRQA
ncbi:hypothetical protein J3369_15575 [Alteromonas sp. NFXS44]|uniref:hypothetical protein n=1 Tax=Alteromonas sp. NFXS44 TaxID=2818435 RepID=UPI0032DFF4E0